MPLSDRGKTAALVSLLAAMLSFGVIPIFLRYFAGYLDAWTVNGVRYSVGALFWLPFLLFLERQPTGAKALATPRNVWRDAIVPSLVNAVGQAFFALGPYYVPASTLGFVIRLSFLFTICFGFAFLPEERRLARQPAFWIGALLSIAGVVLLFVDKLGDGATESWIGMAILVATSAAWGGYAVSVRYWMAAYTARESFAVISIYTSAALVTLMLSLGRIRDLGAIGLDLWGLLMGSALIGIAFGHVLYYRGIHRLGPVVSSGIMLITPFVTYLVAALVLAERLSAVEMIGGVIVVLGGALLVVARGQIEKIADDVP
jgi:drug/metabolite transporter (DMT)-like permease